MDHVKPLSLCAAFALAIGLAGPALASPTFSDDFNDGNLTDQWTLDSQAHSTFTIDNQQLKMTEAVRVGNPYGPGSKLTSNGTLNFTDGPIQFTFQLIGSENGYQLTSLGLQGKVLLTYAHIPPTAAGNPQREFVSLYIDQEGDGLDRAANGQLATSDRVWYSNPWPKGNLVAANHYLGFRMDKNGWAVITSSDGEHYSTLYVGPTNSSLGTFTTPQDLNFTTHAMIYTENSNGDGTVNGSTDLAIDNVNVSVVPEPGSLALLGLGGLMMLKRRR